MTTQITVRIEDTLVEFADALVTAGQARSRAQVVTNALEQERRRLLAERDVEIYAATADPELDAWADWSSAHPPKLDD